MWTRFMDMHSGGGQKLDWPYIYIEAPMDEAKVIFYNRFNRNPERVTCTCCGEDYSIYEEPNLEQATAFERGCDFAYFDEEGKERTQDEWYALSIFDRKKWQGRYVERPAKKYKYREYRTLDEYAKDSGIKVIYAHEILERERRGSVPQEGYVWM